MYIITQIDKNIILDICSKVEYQENGYPQNTDTKVSYVKGFVKIYQIEEIPEYVQVIKYCYTIELGFYENPEYKEPNMYNIPNELLEQIKNDAIQEVQNELNNQAN